MKKKSCRKRSLDHGRWGPGSGSGNGKLLSGRGKTESEEKRGTLSVGGEKGGRIEFSIQGECVI